ncbi:hypothetical protein A3H86_00665 [Candidatus Roizmanbacteria bacterium RIFCSPLOWO2_02_FULL_41_9]|uniref:Glycosyltransferase RgtA/B/C/D-like domain-containing protein n=1 Tax=Candidatus Roizmanbacteria bacterium RIFCSPLOWO2_02_FULL_41_9 TaxID=1802077 RepID=A0A1F7JRQ8_9BACT|nr:MAG: hypothetical protein A3H86_00665 [Candidatus Roizmanbacteria bacterium RIFCSPLOWO2_02_FULL_41_9]
MFDYQVVIHFLKNRFQKRDLVYLGLLILAFFLTRLINIDKFPIFVDEGIYIRWAKTAWHDAAWRFISLTDGRQPLQTWATIPFLKLFPDNLLLGGRLFSVFTGFLSLIGLYGLMFYIIDKKAAYIAGIFYIFTPFFLFYDRLALVDSAVNAGFVWIFMFSVILVGQLRLDVALIFGIISGFALLTKSSDRMFVMLSALAPILTFSKNLKKTISNAVNFYILFTITLILTLLMYNIQRLSPYFHYVAVKNTTFVMTFGDFLQNPFAGFLSNLKLVPLYVFWEMGWFTVIFSALGGYLLYRQNKRLFLYIALWLALPYLAISLFARVIFPRYLIFFATLFLILATYFFSQLKIERLRKVSFIFLFATFLFFDFAIIFQPTKISLPPVDRGQYIEGISAVWGAQDLVKYVQQKSQEKPVIMLAEGDFGLVADVLSVFIKPEDKINLVGLWPLTEKDIFAHQKDIKDHYVYIVFSHREEFPSDWPVKLVKKYTKPVGDKVLYLFELLPKKE